MNGRENSREGGGGCDEATLGRARSDLRRHVRNVPRVLDQELRPARRAPLHVREPAERGVRSDQNRFWKGEAVAEKWKREKPSQKSRRPFRGGAAHPWNPRPLVSRAPSRLRESAAVTWCRGGRGVGAAV